MARRKPSDIYGHISHLEFKDQRKPGHRYVRDRRKRMEMAQRAERMRKTVRKNWAEGLYKDRETRINTQSDKSRAECIAEWVVAEIRAKDLIQKMIDDDILDLDMVVVPGSDEELAKAGLVEVAKMALGPVDKRTKLEALKTLLSFTKQRPATKADVKVSSVEEWLASVSKDDGD